MGNLNPIQLLMALKGGNPKQVAMSIIQNNFPNDPMMQQLLQMATNNDINGLNKFAQEYFSKQGLDFNNEMSNLMNAMKNM